MLDLVEIDIVLFNVLNVTAGMTPGRIRIILTS